jgi:hypothetical protein
MIVDVFGTLGASFWSIFDRKKHEIWRKKNTNYDYEWRLLKNYPEKAVQIKRQNNNSWSSVTTKR